MTAQCCEGGNGSATLVYRTQGFSCAPAVEPAWEHSLDNVFGLLCGLALLVVVILAGSQRSTASITALVTRGLYVAFVAVLVQHISTAGGGWAPQDRGDGQTVVSFNYHPPLMACAFMVLMPEASARGPRHRGGRPAHRRRP